MSTTIRVRGIIIDKDGKIFGVKHIGSDFLALPGGKLEDNEELKAGLERELFEELGKKAIIGNLLFVHEFRHKKYMQMSVEFFFEIKNFEDFSGKLHGEYFDKEIDSYGFFDPESSDFKPEFLKTKKIDKNKIEYIQAIF